MGRAMWHHWLEISFTHFENFKMMYNVSDMQTFSQMASLSQKHTIFNLILFQILEQTTTTKRKKN